ncbi:MAG: hypothetical protein VX757_01950, partial [Planctomycetota bacterium]|nr:hypothetical protein [Planctomycetota bacterium]
PSTPVHFRLPQARTHVVDLNVLVAACLTINPTGKVAKVIDISQQIQWLGSRLQRYGANRTWGIRVL